MDIQEVSGSPESIRNRYMSYSLSSGPFVSRSQPVGVSRPPLPSRNVGNYLLYDPLQENVLRAANAHSGEELVCKVCGLKQIYTNMYFWKHGAQSPTLISFPSQSLAPSSSLFSLLSSPYSSLSTLSPLIPAVPTCSTETGPSCTVGMCSYVGCANTVTP